MEECIILIISRFSRGMSNISRLRRDQSRFEPDFAKTTFRKDQNFVETPKTCFFAPKKTLCPLETIKTVTFTIILKNQPILKISVRSNQHPFQIARSSSSDRVDCSDFRSRYVMKNDLFCVYLACMEGTWKTLLMASQSRNQFNYLKSGNLVFHSEFSLIKRPKLTCMTKENFESHNLIRRPPSFKEKVWDRLRNSTKLSLSVKGISDFQTLFR